MTKTKVSTVAIVVLSVLLAAALASTIVLAAFSFSRSASTTISFASGVTLDVTQGLNKDGTWKVNEVATDGTVGADVSAATSNLTSGVILEEVKVARSANTTANVLVGVAVTITQVDTKTVTAFNLATVPAKVTLGTAVADSSQTTPNFNGGTVITANPSGAGDMQFLTLPLTSDTPISICSALATAYDESTPEFEALASSAAVVKIYVAAVTDNGSTATTDLQRAILGGDFLTWTWS